MCSVFHPLYFKRTSIFIVWISYSHNILRLVNAKEYRTAWYKMLHGIKFVPKATIFFFETDFISQLAKHSNNSPVKDVQMLSDAIANGVHYYSTVTIWAAKIHATLFSMSVLHVSRTHIAQMTAPIFFFVWFVYIFSTLTRHADDTYLREFIRSDKKRKKDEICCIISYQNALEVNSCIESFYGIPQINFNSIHFILVQSAKKRAPFFIASWESRSPCMLINKFHSIKRTQGNEKMHEKFVIKFNNCLRA